MQRNALRLATLILSLATALPVAAQPARPPLDASRIAAL